MAKSAGMQEEYAKLVRQNETIISLLGRIAFSAGEIRDFVTRRKQNPSKYIEGYNACDGRRTVTDVAEIIGVDKSTLSPILRNWEEIGIVYEVERPNGKFYRKLFPIEGTE